ncbi:Hypothetical protein FKW44_012722 [Caligus rogercresseyi]|uniref:Uncharacterized protein n=1 Tax=Caligus rogercresseyi TaxID=217165 RepID=A0A7T8HJR4_CALRO|nr:Hypothetical protein FKW44_012722 [Caligus rogercresseyi]
MILGEWEFEEEEDWSPSRLLLEQECPDSLRRRRKKRSSSSNSSSSGSSSSPPHLGGEFPILTLYS